MSSEVLSVRPLVRVTMLAIGCAALGWALWLIAFGGFDHTVLGIRIRSNNPSRAILIAVLAVTGFLLAGGATFLSPILNRVRGWPAALARRPGRIAVVIAGLSVIVAVGGSTRIAGSSDAYGYVSQADLWLNGNLIVPQPWVAQVPWPNREWTFTPLGYRPAAREGEAAIVPTYAPGLPILMATAKGVGGQCALFAVVPLLLGLAVLATYGLGCRLGSSSAGLIGAWFLATSPVVLDSMEPLTDVPVMGAWTLAFYFLLGRSVRSALAAGVLAALAILIRPNLVLLAAPMTAWFFVRRAPDLPVFRTRFVPAAMFGFAALLGIAAVAIINQHLYGSPSTSGYGRFGDQFAWSRFLPNLGRYLSWFVETQTPIALLGIAALIFPAQRLWPGVVDRRVFVVIGLFVAVLWAEYCAYLEFDSWGYLRFLLPSWPFIMLGLASIMVAAARLNGRAVRWMTAAAIIVLGVWNVHAAEQRGAFEQRQAARHEAPIGRLVRAHTDRNSVVLAFERSGSLRYYAGRITLRYDVLEPDWLDRAVTWLTAHGVHVYAVLDQRQAEECKRRFAGQQTAAAFDHPVLIYEPVGTALFDLSAPPVTRPPIVITEALPDLPGCDPPVRVPLLVVR
jgi:hypothetical protein